MNLKFIKFHYIKKCVFANISSYNSIFQNKSLAHVPGPCGESAYCTRRQYTLT